jgi:hypothetical protein
MSEALTAQSLTARLPGTAPLSPATWLDAGPDYANQMARRERLLDAGDDVVAGASGAGDLIAETCHAIINWLAADERWAVGAGAVTRPDGITIARQTDDLRLIGRLIQEDVLVMAPGVPEYRLAAGVLCFPSRWRLSEKLGRALSRIHTPVPQYDAALARRVNRLFDAVRVGAPLVRHNWLVHPTDRLDQPLGETEAAPAFTADGPYFLRTERQCLWRLPQSRAVLFTVKTTITPVSVLDPSLCEALAAAIHDWSAPEIAYRGGEAVWRGAIDALQQRGCAETVR